MYEQVIHMEHPYTNCTEVNHEARSLYADVIDRFYYDPAQMYEHMEEDLASMEYNPFECRYVKSVK